MQAGVALQLRVPLLNSEVTGDGLSHRVKLEKISRPAPSVMHFLQQGHTSSQPHSIWGPFSFKATKGGPVSVRWKAHSCWSSPASPCTALCLFCVLFVSWKCLLASMGGQKLFVFVFKAAWTFCSFSVVMFPECRGYSHSCDLLIK